MRQRIANIIRYVLGGYLVVQGVGLLMEAIREKPTDQFFLIIMALLFIGIGAVYLIFVFRHWGNTSENEEGEEDQEDDSQAAERPERDQTKFRTAPLPEQSDIIKGMATIPGEEKEEKVRTIDFTDETESGKYEEISKDDPDEEE